MQKPSILTANAKSITPNANANYITAHHKCKIYRPWWQTQNPLPLIANAKSITSHDKSKIEAVNLIENAEFITLHCKCKENNKFKPIHYQINANDFFENNKEVERTQHRLTISSSHSSSFIFSSYHSTAEFCCIRYFNCKTSALQQTIITIMHLLSTTT